MSSMTGPLTDTLIRLFTEQLHVEIPSPDTDLLEAGLIDSLLLVDLFMSIEQEFGVHIHFDDFDLDQFRTVNRIAGSLRRQLNPPAADAA